MSIKCNEMECNYNYFNLVAIIVQLLKLTDTNISHKFN